MCRIANRSGPCAFHSVSSATALEAVSDRTLIELARNQCKSTHGKVCGLVNYVPIVEAMGQAAVGRFGWKNQHASLLSFASDAYLNEQGITNRFNLVENTSMGRFVGAFPYDLVPDDQPCTIAEFSGMVPR